MNKYDHLFGVDIRLFLRSRLEGIIENPASIAFINDANGFLVGETHSVGLVDGKVLGVTLGTGIGSGFVINGKIVTEYEGVPNQGHIYNLPFKGKTVESWISTRWFLDSYEHIFGTPAENVKDIADMAKTSPEAQQMFTDYGRHLGEVLSSISNKFDPDMIVIGGSIAKSFSLFRAAFESGFEARPNIHITQGTVNAAILGAVLHLTQSQTIMKAKRKTTQRVMPMKSDTSKPQNGYDVYPSFEISSGSIHTGMKSLVAELPKPGNIIIEGYMGAYWDEFILELSNALQEKGTNPLVQSITAAYKAADDIEDMVAPYMGGDDPVFGKVFTGTIGDFFDAEKLSLIKPDPNALNIIYGSGASLAGWGGSLIYIDMPKNKIQFRARAAQVYNLGNVFVAG